MVKTAEHCEKIFAISRDWIIKWEVKSSINGYGIMHIKSVKIMHA